MEQQVQIVAYRFLWRKRRRAINETVIGKTTTIQMKITVLEKNQTLNALVAAELVTMHYNARKRVQKSRKMIEHIIYFYFKQC